MSRSIEDILQIRHDISARVIHMTRNQGTQMAKEIFKDLISWRNNT